METLCQTQMQRPAAQNCEAESKLVFPQELGQELYKLTQRYAGCCGCNILNMAGGIRNCSNQNRQLAWNLRDKCCRSFAYVKDG